MVENKFVFNTERAAGCQTLEYVIFFQPQIPRLLIYKGKDYGLGLFNLFIKFGIKTVVLRFIFVNGSCIVCGYRHIYLQADLAHCL